MKIGAIIAEYNPFHNGHTYQLEKSKELRYYENDVKIFSALSDENFRQLEALADEICAD